MKIITLTLNPAFDMHCFCESFSPYHENLASITALEAGGKGVNISRALTSLGVENTALVVLGDENADSFVKALRDDGINSICIEAEGRIRENITLHTSGSPETRISFRGFKADSSLLSQVEEKLDALVDSDTVLTFTGSMPEGISVSDAKKMLMKMKAKGARIVIDSKSFTFDDLRDVCPWLIKPNEEEISAYSSLSVNDLEDAARAADELRGICSENVMISLGGAGAVLSTSEGIFISSAPRIEVRSTIGAGDSSIAGFIAAASEGCAYPEMLRRAICYGSAACMSEGTRPPKKEDVDNLIKTVEVKKI